MFRKYRTGSFPAAALGRSVRRTAEARRLLRLRPLSATAVIAATAYGYGSAATAYLPATAATVGYGYPAYGYGYPATDTAGIRLYGYGYPATATATATNRLWRLWLQQRLSLRQSGGGRRGRRRRRRGDRQRDRAATITAIATIRRRPVDRDRRRRSARCSAARLLPATAEPSCKSQRSLREPVGLRPLFSRIGR